MLRARKLQKNRKDGGARERRKRLPVSADILPNVHQMLAFWWAFGKMSALSGRRFLPFLAPSPFLFFCHFRPPSLCVPPKPSVHLSRAWEGNVCYAGRILWLASVCLGRQWKVRHGFSLLWGCCACCSCIILSWKGGPCTL